MKVKKDGDHVESLAGGGQWPFLHWLPRDNRGLLNGHLSSRSNATSVLPPPPPLHSPLHKHFTSLSL